MNETKSGYIQTDGARLFFEESGAGPVIFFLHAGVADMRMWDEQIEALSENFRCIRFDQRGFGRTENQVESFDPTADLRAVLDALGVREAHLVGNSLGGMVAIDFALHQPERVTSLVLVASGLSGWRSGPTEEEMPMAHQMDVLEKSGDWDRLVDAELHFWLDGPLQPAGRVSSEVRNKMRDMCRGAYARDEPEGKRVELDPPAIDRLTEIHVPAMVMVGDYDVFAIRELAGYLVANLKNASLSTYEGAAHMISLEQPARFNAELRTFLERVPSVTSP